MNILLDQPLAGRAEAVATLLNFTAIPPSQEISP